MLGYILSKSDELNNMSTYCALLYAKGSFWFLLDNFPLKSDMEL